jgi:hypothetical protein
VKPAPFLNAIFFGSDQFFSGHTGLPFLAALTFWHMPFWRYFYLGSTVFFGMAAALGPRLLRCRGAQKARPRSSVREGGRS